MGMLGLILSNIGLDPIMGHLEIPLISWNWVTE
jgi:TctA family transporter